MQIVKRKRKSSKIESVPAKRTLKSTKLIRKNHKTADSIVNQSIQHRSDLLIMNDDCIIEILNHLELKDLSSMANTCCRLRILARMAFSSKYRSKQVTLEESENTVEDCLRNFGSQMQSIYFKRPSNIPSRIGDGSHILRLLIKYCPLLTRLEVHHYNFASGFSDEMQTMLSHLRHFRLSTELIPVESYTQVHRAEAAPVNN